jgi:hypothetical protein
LFYNRLPQKILGAFRSRYFERNSFAAKSLQNDLGKVFLYQEKQRVKKAIALLF